MDWEKEAISKAQLEDETLEEYRARAMGRNRGGHMDNRRRDII